jgi:beta-phosphoglucomutase
MIQGIIFDMDGVIVDSEDLHGRAWLEFAKKYNLNFTMQDSNETIGITNFGIFERYFPHFKKDDYKKLDDEKESMYRELAKDELQLLPDVIDLIKSLKTSGFKMIVGSSGNPKNIQFIFDKFDLNQYFVGFVSSHDVTNGKPHPEVFLKSAQKLNLKPDECVVIEDAHHGIDAAISAGIKVIAITTTHPKEKLVKANLIVNSIKEITIDKIKSL